MAPRPIGPHPNTATWAPGRSPPGHDEDAVVRTPHRLDERRELARELRIPEPLRQWLDREAESLGRRDELGVGAWSGEAGHLETAALVDEAAPAGLAEPAGDHPLRGDQLPDLERSDALAASHDLPGVLVSEHARKPRGSGELHVALGVRLDAVRVGSRTSRMPAPG